MPDYRSNSSQTQQQNLMDALAKVQQQGQFQQSQGLAQQRLGLEGKQARLKAMFEGGNLDSGELTDFGKQKQAAEQAGYRTEEEANTPDSPLSKGVQSGYNKVVPGMMGDNVSAAGAKGYLQGPLEAKAHADAERAALLARQNNFNSKQLTNYQHNYSGSIKDEQKAEQSAGEVKNLIAQAMTSNSAASQALPVIAARLFSHGQRINIQEISAAKSPADIETYLKNKYFNKATGALDPKFAQDMGSVADTLQQSAHQAKSQKAMLAAQQYSTESGIPLEQAYPAVTSEAFPTPQNQQSPLPKNVAPAVPQPPAPQGSQPGAITGAIQKAVHPLAAFFGLGGDSKPQRPTKTLRNKTTGETKQVYADTGEDVPSGQ